MDSTRPGSRRGLEYLCNAEFDLSLRRAWSGQLSARYLDDMTCAWITAGTADDAVCVRRTVPRPFLDTLEALGLELPQLVAESSCRPDLELAPLGWNQRAIDHNRRHTTRAEHPALEAVRRANSRALSLEVERQLTQAPGVAPTAVTTMRELEQLLGTGDDSALGWVVKANHGNAAMANRRAAGGQLTPSQRRQISRWLEEDDLVVVEPWLQRAADLCVVLTIDRDGAIEDRRLHEAVHTADGGFIGAMFDADAPQLKRHRTALQEATAAVAESLTSIGYFGPVCIDALVYEDNGTERLRPVVDINARRHISLAARPLLDTIANGRCVLWRFFSADRLRLPETPRSQDLAPLGFDRTARTGVAVTSPPVTRSADGRRRRSAKVAVLMVAADRSGVLELETAFRTRWERR